MNESELRERTRELLAEVDPDAGGDRRVEFRGAQFDRGLAWVGFPEGLGGLGLEPKLQMPSSTTSCTRAPRPTTKAC